MAFPSRTKNWIFLLVISLLCIATARFCHHQTHGFRISKIHHNLKDSHVEPLNSDEVHFIRSLFAYKFRYLGRGHQSFVFLSDDDVHVVKIFNNCHQRKITFFKAFSYLPFIGTWASGKALLFKKKLEKIFASYHIAFTEMKAQTGLLFAHLNASDNLPALNIVDPLNITHRLNPNELGFLIQKKATLVYPTLDAFIQNNDLSSAKRALCNLLDLLIWKCRHGIQDNDPLIRTNFGFLNGEAIQIDVGPFSKDETVQDLSRMREEIFRITSSLKHWLKEKCPELVIYLDQQLQERLSF